ncbi:Hypothetical predicted protein [Olea europaea subsp. europaea]|uniref:Uncharacterized protein n=1 Tax=Olea europaea subsp. europaea TaxID=158383 RepID=A0A8S0UCP4_OLEEU|nr:Hypothetical predicted protein [Olea europaea subsp. europaea]
MEDDKLAAYYDELTQKGGGAARFKQGLGFSSTTPANNTVPPRGSALPSTSSFLSSFVKASSPTASSSFHKQAQLESIQNKLNKAPNVKPPNQDKNSRSSSRRSGSRSRSPDRDKTRDRHSRRRSRSQSRSPVRYSRRRSRSSSRSQSPNGYSRHRHRSRDRRARRRSRSREDYGSRRKHQSRSRSRERERERSKRRSRSGSPGQRMEKGRKRGEKKNGVGGGGRVDYTKLIEGYDKMTPAERVKAKMELQLSKTAEKDKTRGMGSGWERFDFNKDAPLDDEEIEAVEDDAALVKHLGQSFRFSVVEAKKEEDIKAAHDEAMFGASSLPLHADTDNEEEEDNNTKEENGSSPVKSLLSNQVLTMQQGSWRDRARKG